MSLFKTSIPIDVNAVLAKLPPKAFLHSITLLPDHSAVEIVWDADQLKTGRTYPVECPLESLRFVNAVNPAGLQTFPPVEMTVIDNVIVKESVDKPKRARKTTVEDA